MALLGLWLAFAGECSAGEGDGCEAHSEEREGCGFGDRAAATTEGAGDGLVFADGEVVVVLVVRRSEGDGGIDAEEFDESIALVAGDTGAGRVEDQAAATVFCTATTASDGEGFTGVEVEAGLLVGLTEAPDGKNGVGYGAGEGDGFNSRVPAFHMDGSSVDRRTVADDPADPSSGRSPGGTTVEPAELTGVGDGEAGHSGGGCASGGSIGAGSVGGPCCPDEGVCMGGGNCSDCAGCQYQR